MRDPRTSVALPPLEEPVRGAWVGWLVVLLGFLALVGLSVLYPVPRALGRKLEGPVLGLVASVSFTMLGLFVAAHLRPRVVEWLRRRRFLAAIRAVREARATPSEGAVRIRGRVQWRDSESVWVDADDGRVALPVDAVRARSEEGPRTYLRIGEEVEAVGRIRVVPSAAEAYRDSRALELHGDAVLVWAGHARSGPKSAFVTMASPSHTAR